MEPVPLLAWAAAHTRFELAAPHGAATTAAAPPRPATAVLCGPGAVDSALAHFDLTLAVHAGQDSSAPPCVVVAGGDLFLYQVRGGSGGSGTRVTVTRAAISESSGDIGPASMPTAFTLGEGDVMLIPGGGRFAVSASWAERGLCIAVASGAGPT